MESGEEKEVLLERRVNQIVISNFWAKVAGVTFGVWALAIPVGVSIVRDGITAVTLEQKASANALMQFIASSDRRMILLEDRQQVLLKRMAEHDAILLSLQLDQARDQSKKGK